MRRLLALTLGLVVLGTGSAQAACGVRTRSEVRTLSADSLNRFVTALKKLQSGTKPTAFDKLVKFHFDNASKIHANAQFYPWHRRFLLDLETKLMAIDPNVRLPYWNFSLDSGHEATTPVLQPAMFGGPGTGAAGTISGSKAVLTGFFANLGLSYEKAHVLTRATSFKVFPTSAQFASAKTRTTYDTYRSAVEYTLHGNIHNYLGGDDQSNASPNDPLFWMYHAFLDKEWADWQAKTGNATRYEGRNANGTVAKTTDPIVGYGTQTVSSVMSMTALCYRYVNPSSPPATSRATAARRQAPTADGATGLATTVTLNADDTVIRPGTAVRLTASVANSEGAGSIRFVVDGLAVAGCESVPLRFTDFTWQASCEVGGLAPSAAAHQVGADFLGAGFFQPSSATLPGGVLVSAAVAPVTFAVPHVSTYGVKVAEDLGATSPSPGTFSYHVTPFDPADPARDIQDSTVLPAGSYDLAVRFTPTDGTPAHTVTVPYTVRPATLTITPDDKDAAAGDLPPQITWLASGFVNDETPSVIQQQPFCDIEGADEKKLKRGTYPIRCAGGVAANYAFAHPSAGTLTVRKVECKKGTACATDAPPSATERKQAIVESFVCRPPVPADSRKKVDEDTNANGQEVSTWRAESTPDKF